MPEPKRIRDYGVIIGELPAGERNAITDVAGVKVGHCTLNEGPIQTGVTAVIPRQGNLFRNKVLAATHIINGFGKSAGLIQVEEMGVLETPIILTNTLSVGTAYSALAEYMLDENEDIGTTTGTVNPVVCECNDGYLNDIRAMSVRAKHVRSALASATSDFEEGAVGAGRGMSCFKLKGGIGTASRRIEIEGNFHLGALVMSNMGQTRDLTVAGKNIGREICRRNGNDTLPDVGSVIIILATDAPLCERQLKRLSKRAVVGLARTGSNIGTGSGEIVLAFTTQNGVPHYDESAIETYHRVHEKHMDQLFRAAAESVEEAVLNSMTAAVPVTGRDGLSRQSLGQYEDLIHEAQETQEQEVSTSEHAEEKPPQIAG
jgi:D-aminopeptidase